MIFIISRKMAQDSGNKYKLFYNRKTFKIFKGVEDEN